MVKKEVLYSDGEQTSPGFPSKPVSNLQFLLAILFGGVLFFGILYLKQVPDRLQRGQHGQTAIQSLDAMRRPLLVIMKIEAQFIEVGRPASTTAVLDETTEQADQRLLALTAEEAC
jgi:hypothetical protein